MQSCIPKINLRNWCTSLGLLWENINTSTNIRSGQNINRNIHRNVNLFITRQPFGEDNFDKLGKNCQFFHGTRQFFAVSLLPCNISYPKPEKPKPNFQFLNLRSLLSALAKLRKPTVSFVMSVRLSFRPSAWNNSTPIGPIFMKIGI